MKSRTAFVGLVALVGAFGVMSSVAAQVDGKLEPQPLPATFEVPVPDTGGQQFAIFTISGKASKQVFKKITIKVTNKDDVAQNSFGNARYAAAITKPVTKSGVTSVEILLAINDIGTPGEYDNAVCFDGPGPGSPQIPCDPGNLELRITAGGKPLVASTDAGFGIPQGARELQVVGEIRSHASRIMQLNIFPSSPAEILDNTIADAKKNA